VLATAAIIFWPKPNAPQEIKIINEIKNYGYTLADNETELHKQYFDNLVQVLKADDIDEETYAKLVVQLFVSDFYNLDNKPTKNDVGGIQYVYTGARDNMVLKAKDTIYKYIESNINDNRNQRLPIVSNVEITKIVPTEFKYGTKTDKNAYEIKATWTYKTDLEYQDNATFKLIHEDKKLSIAELE
jgi:hypothetical protein